VPDQNGSGISNGLVPEVLNSNGNPVVLQRPEGSPGLWKGMPRDPKAGPGYSRRQAKKALFVYYQKLVDDEPPNTLTRRYEINDPVKLAMFMIVKGYNPIDGSFIYEDTLIKLLNFVGPFLYPKLTSTQVKVDDHAPLIDARTQIVKLIASDPQTRSAMEQIEQSVVERMKENPDVQ
jgi:hypothetical protein